MANDPCNIFFSVGEPSGDLHGANLIRALRAENATVRISGFGGPQMRAAGMEQMADLTQLAVMWIAQAVANVGTFRKLLRQADQYFAAARPAAVVLIDYPGFNWWVARKARKHGIPVFYYGAPQLWAWGSWRIGKMRRLVDEVLCKLPFEATWYQQRGCNAHYVGHPYFDQLLNQQLDQDFMQRHATRDSVPLITILPGSRSQEVRNNLPWLAKAARLIRQQVRQVRFAVAAYNDAQADQAQSILSDIAEPIEVHTARTGELIRISHSCMACSGSVSLELMFYGKPSVIHYWLPRTTYWLGSRLVQLKYMTLVNLLACEDRFDRASAPYDPHADGADQVPFPEYPTYGDRSADLARHIVRWLTDPVEYHRRCDQLSDLRRQLCVPGASQRAAQSILDHLTRYGLDNPEIRRNRAA